jgi:hypothetical protein
MIIFTRLLLLALVGLACETAACPLPEMIRESQSDLNALRKDRLSISATESAEGGYWELYSRHDGLIHSAVRYDFGETGQRQLRASFVGPELYSISEIMQHYAEPIQAGTATVIQSEYRQQYLYCEGTVYSGGDLTKPIRGDQLVRALELKAEVFCS